MCTYNTQTCLTFSQAHVISKCLDSSRKSASVRLQTAVAGALSLQPAVINVNRLVPNISRKLAESLVNLRVALFHQHIRVHFIQPRINTAEWMNVTIDLTPKTVPGHPAHRRFAESQLCRCRLFPYRANILAIITYLRRRNMRKAQTTKLILRTKFLKMKTNC